MEPRIPVSAIDTLVLPEAIRQELMVHLLHSAPNEGVGLLGVRTPERIGSTTIARGAMWVPGKNIDESPTHFTMDPLDVIRAFRAFADAGFELGAVVHSHVKGPATPSETDVHEWNYPEALMLIASFADQPPSLAAWRVVEKGHLAVVQAVGLAIEMGTE